MKWRRRIILARSFRLSRRFLAPVPARDFAQRFAGILLGATFRRRCRRWLPRVRRGRRHGGWLTRRNARAIIIRNDTRPLQILVGINVTVSLRLLRFMRARLPRRLRYILRSILRLYHVSGK
jgi:hypothetical protein